jgi:hypothetical protein
MAGSLLDQVRRSCSWTRTLVEVVHHDVQHVHYHMLTRELLSEQTAQPEAASPNAPQPILRYDD